MRVLGIMASPRKLGNSEICIKEILRSLPQEWEKEIINLSKLHLEACRACYACLPQGKNCVIDDDLAFFLTKLRQADRIVIAAPVYFLGEQTAIKLLTDRLISILNEGATYFTNKPCVIAIPHAIAGWEGYARESMLNFAAFLGLHVLDCRVLNKMLPGDVVDEDSLAVLHTLAKELEENKETDWKKNAALCCPICHSSILQFHQDKSWHCVMCGSDGLVQENGERLSLSVTQGQTCRFSPEGLASHGQILLNVNAEFIKRRREVIKHLKPYKD
jgi:NAD(P)H-dependent FMN reductase/ribosomal protein S27AE